MVSGALALAACERFEGPGFQRSPIFAVDAQRVVAPDGRRVFFPRSRREPGAREAVGVVAPLTLQGECLLFGDILVVWPPGARLDVSQPGRMLIEHRGQVAVVGRPMITSSLERAGRLDPAIPNPCPGRTVHTVSSFQLYEESERRITRPPARPTPRQEPAR